MRKKRKNLSYRILSAYVIFTFAVNFVLPPPAIFAQLIPPTILNLPAPGTMVSLSPTFNPVLVRGLTIHPDNPLRFDFIVDPGDDNFNGEALTKESNKLIKYFLAALTTPEDEIWVNLSPYEKERMIPQGFGDTQMGRDLLAQDYFLKQLTASLMYPEKELGREFWDKVYKKAYSKYGTTEVPVDTFNKVWIVPEKAVVYEHESSAFVLESRLKVMLEQDYEAMNANASRQTGSLLDPNKTIPAEIIRDIIIPAIEKEVNEGKTFANLRQIYNSMILATWYKIRLKDSLLGQVYVDKGKTKGVDTEDKEINQKIYNQYLDAFKQGVYNYIKEDYDSHAQAVIPRKYFSGGFASSNPAFGTLNKIVGMALIVAAVGTALPGDVQARVSALDNPRFQRVTWESGEIGKNFDADYLRSMGNVQLGESADVSVDLSLKEAGKVFAALSTLIAEQNGASSPIEGQETSIRKIFGSIMRKATLASLVLVSALTFTSDQNQISQVPWEEIREWIITDRNDGEYFARTHSDQLVGSELRGILERAKYENPKLVLSIIDLYENEPYAIEFIEAALRNDPISGVKLFPHYKHLPKAKEWLKQSVFNVLKLDDFFGVKVIFQNMSYFRDEPYVQEAIEKATHINRDMAIQHEENIRFLANADDIIQKAVLYVAEHDMHELKGGSVSFDAETLAAVMRFLDKPYRDKIIAGMLEYHPKAFLENADQVLHFKDGKEIIRKAAQELLADSMGWVVFDHAELFIDEPNGSSLVQQAIEMVGLKSLLEHKDILARLPDHQGENILRKKIEGLASNMYGAIDVIRAAEALLDLPYLPAALDSAIEYAAEEYLENAEKFKDLPGARERLKKAVFKSAEGLQFRLNNTVWVLRHADKVKNEPYVQEAISMAAANDIPGAIEHFDKYRSLPNASDILAKALKTAADSSEGGIHSKTEILLSNANRLKNFAGIEEYVRRAGLNNPKSAMFDFDGYNQIPNAKEILKTAVFSSVAGEKFLAGTAILAVDRYIDQPYAERIVQQAAAINPEDAIEYFEYYKSLPQAMNIAQTAAKALLKSNPSYLVSNFKNIRNLFDNADEILEEAVLKEPSGFMQLRSSSLGERNLVIDRLMQRDNPLIVAFLRIVNKDGISRDADEKTAQTLALFNDIARHGLTVEEAEKIVGDPVRFFNRLIQIKNEPGHIGEIAVERYLSEVSLRLVHQINSLHEENDLVRFASVAHATPQQLYTMMVYGEEEVFTSTFNGLFNRLIERMSREHLSGDQLLKDVQYNDFRTFIKLATSYNRLTEFFNTLSRGALNDLLERFIGGIDQEEDLLKEAVIAADTLSMVKDGDLRNLFLRLVKQEYQQLGQKGKKEQKVIYGLLANIVAGTPEWLPDPQLYQLPDLSKISTKPLFEDGVHTQRYTFFDDKDGRASYGNFLSQYQNDGRWRIEDKENYVVVSSSRGVKIIKIYVNKPDKVSEGNDAIDLLFKNEGIVPQFVIHRGHSYHVGQTLRYISPRTILVFLGSCGGYSNISKVSDLAPKSLVFSTKGTGTMRVNDPLLKMINENIFAQDTLDWSDFWSMAEERLGSLDDFSNYIAPHKNIGVMFIKAYRRLIYEKDLQGASSPVAESVISDQLPVTRISSASDERTKEVGGIDLDSSLLDLQIKRDGNGTPLPLPQQPVGEMNIEGFFPIIINVAPATNLPLLLGLRTNPDQDTVHF